MIVPHEKCTDCRAYIKGVCKHVWSLYEARPAEELERAAQEIMNCTWQSNGVN